MRKIRIFAIAATATLCCTACLNKYPSDAILADDALQNVEEVNQAVVGIYSAYKSAALYSGYLTLLPDIQTDLVYAVNGYSNTYGDIWRWNILSTDTQTEAVYSALYGVIGRCNFLLDKLPALEETITDDDQLDRLDSYRGEALFARALAYSELIKLFCKPYEGDDKAREELGVVLRTHYNSSDPPVRSSLYDSYAQVIADLDEAAELLKVEDDYSGTLYNSPYLCEFTAYALRARVALYMQDWQVAADYATRVIGSGRYSLMNANDNSYSYDYNDYQYMWATGNSTETIWKVGFTTTSYGGALGSVFFNYDYVSYKPDYVPALWVLNSYSSADLRYDAFFVALQTGYDHGLTWPLLAKYWGEDSFWNIQVRHMIQPKVFRLAEQYLIRAEAYARLGNLSKAAEDITTLRRARYSSGYSTSFSSEDAAMTVIEAERVKELYMEGFRLQDLKRWHKGFSREPQTESLSNGSSLEIAADDPLFVWPIPRHELEAPGSMVEPNESNGAAL